MQESYIVGLFVFIHRAWQCVLQMYTIWCAVLLDENKDAASGSALNHWRLCDLHWDQKKALRLCVCVC